MQELNAIKPTNLTKTDNTHNPTKPRLSQAATNDAILPYKCKARFTSLTISDSSNLYASLRDINLARHLEGKFAS